jgi:tetratricopeptide (TPR) repeat protein
MGDAEGSLAASKKFLELDPLDVVGNIHLAWHFVMARQFDEAIEQCFKSKELFPNSFWPYFCLGLNYERKGLIDESRAAFEQAISIGGDITFAYAGLGHLYATSGQKAKAEEIIASLSEMAKTRYVPSFDVALIYAGLGDDDSAFGWLEKAYQERSSWMAYLKIEPRLDSLRSDQRFSDLLKRVGLA